MLDLIKSEVFDVIAEAKYHNAAVNLHKILKEYSQKYATLESEGEFYENVDFAKKQIKKWLGL